MVTRLFSKKQTQAVLKDLKHAGYIVTKEIGGRGNRYTVYIDNQTGTAPVLEAISGTRGYLVSYEEQLLTN